MVRGFRRSRRKIFGETVQKIVLVLHRKLILRSHNQAVGRTGIRAQIAITAEGHIDVKLRDSEFDGRPIGRENGQILFGPFLRRHVDAIHRTSTDALATANTVLYLVKQTHPRTFREIPFLIGILQCHRTRKQMQIRDLHADQDGPYRLEDISKVLLHETPF